jgi:hypothetical protein
VERGKQGASRTLRYGARCERGIPPIGGGGVADIPPSAVRLAALSVSVVPRRARFGVVGGGLCPKRRAYIFRIAPLRL